MTTITKEWLQKTITSIESARDEIPFGLDEDQSNMLTAFKIALVSLEAKPIGAFHITEQQVDGTSDYIKDGEWPIDNGTIEVYAAPPVPVVPEEKPMPNALSMLEREITQLIGDAQEATVTGYELIAEAWRLMDGQDPKTSDWHSKASKYLNSNIVEKVDDDRIEAVKAVLRRLAGNSPVIPGEVLSAIMKVARVRADFDDFDGDRRGIGDCLDEAEQELIVTINKYASQLAVVPVGLDERAAFNAWNNDENLPIAGVGAKNAAWLAWQARAELGRSLAVNSPVIPDSWISCSERMPNDGQHVIILCDGAFVLYAQYRDGEFFDVVRNGEEFFETQSRNVTHWMPLPEPPQEVNQ
ncbi:DUF551 domain-containing protein [Escherichia coli]|nr:DUF551 domain-containing protein [Escherichia coli]